MKKLLAVGLVLASSVAMAAETSVVQEVFKDTGVSVKVGTNGIGLDLTKSFDPMFKVRLGYSEYTYSKTINSNETVFDGKLKLGGLDLLGDYHPFSGGFRITGGLFVPTTKFSGNATYSGSGSVKLNGNTYTSADVSSVNGEAKWSGVKPYLGIGYDGFNASKDGGFFFTSDFGVTYMGAAKTSLNANCVSASAATCAQLNTDVQAEKANFDDKAKRYKWFPVIQVGVGYRF